MPESDSKEAATLGRRRKDIQLTQEEISGYPHKIKSKDLAVKYGVSMDTILKRLRETGVKIASKGPLPGFRTKKQLKQIQLRKIKIKNIKHLRASNLSYNKIAKIWGVSRQRIHTLLKLYGGD